MFSLFDAQVVIFSSLFLFIAMASPTAAADQQPNPGSWRGQSVTEFEPAETGKFDWKVINDGVMGGLSKGNLEFTERNTMKFSGSLSLKNNGGFHDGA